MSGILVAERLGRTLAGEVPVTLVHDIDLIVEPGEFITIMGPSGSGKSSLLYLLGLLDTPTSGRVLLENVDTTDVHDDDLADLRLGKLGFVFQFHFLLAEFSCLDNVALPMRKLGDLPEEAILERAVKLLTDVGLEEHASKRPSQLSGGQQQRVAVARALANDPLIILADEPTGNLDTASTANVRDMLRGLVDEQNRTVIAVSHDSTIGAVADRIVGLVDGRIDPEWRP